MTMWFPDTCGCHPPCQIEIDDKTAEFVRHVSRCKNHEEVGYDHKEVAAECQSKELARHAAKKAMGLADDHDWFPDWELEHKNGQRRFTLTNIPAQHKGAARAAIAQLNRRHSVAVG